jgi:lysophospholipase L1-like esterase
MSSRSAIRRWLARLGLVLAACVLTLALAETLLATLFPQLNPLTRGGYLDADPELGWVLHPGWHTGDPYEISINRLGMRDLELPAKRPGAFRVLVIGDSFTFGTVPLEETYVKRLQDLLQQSAGAPVEVLNGGVPAYSPTQELGALRRWLAPVQPDAILLGLFVGNDFEELEPTRAADACVVDGALVDRALANHALTWQGELRTRLARTHLFQLWRRIRPLPDEDDATKDKRYAWLEMNRLRIYFSDPQNDDWWQERVRRMRAALTDFKSLAAELHLPLVVAIFPDVIQVEDQVMERVASLRPGIGKVALDFERPQRALKDLLRDLDLPTVDLLDDFRQAAHQGPLYGERDTHWNREGNDLAARLIAPTLALTRK